MTMAPIETYEGEAREVFAKTRVIFEDLKEYTENPLNARDRRPYVSKVCPFPEERADGESKGRYEHQHHALPVSFK